MAGKTRKNTAPKGRKKQSRWLLLMFIIPIIAGIIFLIMPKPSPKASGPQFQKEGYLQFISRNTGKAIASIDIELAADDESRSRGLMWRKAMQEDQGMLFVMEESEIQSFWMLNTYIPLDIIFVDTQMAIVTIRSHTVPQSLKPVTSDQSALYVVEVNAGFCEKFGISVGDKIVYDLINNTR